MSPSKLAHIYVCQFRLKHNAKKKKIFFDHLVVEIASGL